MLQRRTIAWLLISLWAVVFFGQVCGGSRAESGEIAAADRSIVPSERGESNFSGSASRSGRDAPQQVYALLAQILQRDGLPLPGYVGGKDFRNRERRLPKGLYREYDIYPKIPGRPRGPERIVIERTTGKAYYTGDHYRTFIPLN